MQFDRQNDPSPLPAELAVSRGVMLINGPVLLFLLAGAGIAYLLLERSSTLTVVLVVLAGLAVAWLWWSWFIPQWRSWALSRGVDPDELQDLGEGANLIWPRGSFFERTEIRRNGR